MSNDFCKRKMRRSIGSSQVASQNGANRTTLDTRKPFASSFRCIRLVAGLSFCVFTFMYLTLGALKTTSIASRLTFTTLSDIPERALRSEYWSREEQDGRRYRFPSVPDRVKLYMGPSWYNPPCEGNSEAKILFNFVNETGFPKEAVATIF